MSRTLPPVARLWGSGRQVARAQFSCGYDTTPAAGVSRTLPPVARLWGSARQAARAQVFCGYDTTPAAGVPRTLPPVTRLWVSGRQAARAQVFCGYYTRRLRRVQAGKKTGVDFLPNMQGHSTKCAETASLLPLDKQSRFRYHEYKCFKKGERS